MLVDIRFDRLNVSSKNEWLKHWKLVALNNNLVQTKFLKNNHLRTCIQRIDRGLYWSASLDHEIELFSGRKVKRFYGTGNQTLREKIDDPRNAFNCYGVSDSVEQWRELKEQTYNDLEEEFVVGFMTLTQETDPGFRWHKNGPYIGIHKPQCEHLGDEPHIKKIVLWRAHMLEPQRTRSKNGHEKKG